jgi:hypothetical protein
MAVDLPVGSVPHTDNAYLENALAEFCTQTFFVFVHVLAPASY